MMHMQNDISDRVDRNNQSELINIAHAAASLSETVPELAHLCGEMEKQAHQQAEQAQKVGQMTQHLFDTIGQSIKELRISSGQTKSVIETIESIADATKILALNATIQAVKVGNAGRGFTAVADNIKKLATETSHATQSVDSSLTSIRESVDQVSDSIGISSNTDLTRIEKTDHNKGLNQLNAMMSDIVESSAEQHESVMEIRKLGDRAQTLAENLFLSFGRFRLEYHKTVETIITRVIQEDAFQLCNRSQMENRMMDLSREYAFLQLAYVTDGNGIQITSNISSECENAIDQSVYGKNWSDRSWFRQVLTTQKNVISDIYRSVSTNKFCFTVSAPITDPKGTFHGVMALDIDLVKLLDYLDGK